MKAVFGYLSAAAFASWVGVVAHADAATPAYDTFASEAAGLLSSSASAQLTAQASSSKGPVASIQPFRTPEDLRGYKTIFDSTAIMVTFPVIERDRLELTRNITALLEKSKRVTTAPLDQAQSILYTGISIRKHEDSALVEVLVAVADAPATKAKKAGGANNITALTKSTIWMSVARRRLSWDAVSTDGTLVFEKIEKDVMDMFRDGMGNLLLAFQ